jgi:5-methylcytosine-specific restriction endonuclease McrA
MGSNEKKAATLGMPHGTAVGRLRKNILYSILKRINENICFRCKLPIGTVDDLSVEHIKPWEGVSAELFWDLNNIAFSHIRCNVPHKRHGGIFLRKIGPEGTSWCWAHKRVSSD